MTNLDDVDLLLRGVTESKLNSMSQRKKMILLRAMVQKFKQEQVNKKEVDKLNADLKEKVKENTDYKKLNKKLMSELEVNVSIASSLKKEKADLEHALSKMALDVEKSLLEKNSHKYEAKKISKLLEDKIHKNKEIELDNKLLLDGLLDLQKIYVMSKHEEKDDLILNSYLELQKKLVLMMWQCKKSDDGIGRVVINSSQDIKYFGAEDRMKNDFSYILGQTLISSTSEFKGVIKLPFLLTKNIWNFNKNSNNYMIPIDCYADKVNADKVQKHLSYRIGCILTEGEKIITRKKVYKILKEIIDFKGG